MQKIDSTPRKSPALHVVLWILQVLVGAFFAYAGYLKLSTPPSTLAEMMPWTAQYPALVPITSIADIAGGLGLVLPAATNIYPRLTIWAAIGLLVLQSIAIIFHLSRGEASATPLNLVLVILVSVILWGRTTARPISRRPS